MLMLLWVNVHGGFVLGLVLLGLPVSNAIRSSAHGNRVKPRRCKVSQVV